MSDQHTIRRHKRNARELAAESEVFDADDLRVCLKCGKVVIYSPNMFAERTGSNYCPCDERGVPMVCPAESGGDSDE